MINYIIDHSMNTNCLHTISLFYVPKQLLVIALKP